MAGAGHERAFAVIVERYRGELYAHARRLSSDGQAEDIIQQTFLSAFAALRSGTEVKHLRGWLYQIVRHAATRLRSPRDSTLDVLRVPGDAVDDVVQRRVLAISALTEVGRLPDRQREALVGMVQGRRRAEIAVSMGLSEGAVRQLVHRARMTVRDAVTAVTPLPLARWAAAASFGGPPADVAAGAGAASAGGIAMKLGALVASGVIAGGIVADTSRQTDPRHSTGPAVGGAVTTHARGGATPGAAAISASAAPGFLGSQSLLVARRPPSAAVVLRLGRANGGRTTGGGRSGGDGRMDVRAGSGTSSGDGGNGEGEGGSGHGSSAPGTGGDSSGRLVGVGESHGERTSSGPGADGSQGSRSGSGSESGGPGPSSGGGSGASGPSGSSGGSGSSVGLGSSGGSGSSGSGPGGATSSSGTGSGDGVTGGDRVAELASDGGPTGDIAGTSAGGGPGGGAALETGAAASPAPSS